MVRTHFNTFSDCSGKFSVAIASFRFDFDLYENHTDAHKKTRDAFPFEASIGRHRLFAVDVCGTLWKLDKRTRNGWSNIVLHRK